MTEKIRPTKVRLEASSFCQLRCPSCPTTTRAIHPHVGSGFLRFEDFKKFLDGNPEVRDIELSNYGEIFLNPEIADIVRYAFEKNVALRADNGANLNNIRDEVIEALVRYRFQSMTCSIDGASNETYQKYRIRGDFDHVIANIRKINAMKAQLGSPYPALAWQFVVFGHNEHELPAARRMAEELDMKFRAKLSWDSDLSPIKDRDYVMREAGFEAATREEYREQVGTDYMQRICHQLWDQPQINYDGKVLGCCRNFWGDFGGNAFRDGLAESVNNEKIAYARAMLQGHAAERSDIPCTTCELYLGMKTRGQFLSPGKRD